jgi:hypothetical protein
MTLLSFSVIAKNTITVNVMRNKTFDENPVTYSASFDLDKSNYYYKTIWRSPKGINCDISILDTTKKEGMFTCESPESYKAQTTFNCATDTSIDKSTYMFFGHVGFADEIGNFYIWCE